MKAEDSRRYSSTKFTILLNAHGYGSTRKNYFICFTIATLFFCITVVYFSCKSFVTSTHDGHQNPQSPTSATLHPKYSGVTLYNPKPFLSAFRIGTSKDNREFSCEESQLRLEAIPAKLVREILRKTYENIHDYVNLDLMMHYENIINKYKPTSLLKIFNKYQMKLSSMKSSRDFLNFLKGLKSNKCKFYGNHLKEESLELKNFDNFFALTEELSHWYNYLNRLSMFLKGYEQQRVRNYSVNCTEENFQKFTEETQKRLFRFAYPFSVTEKKLQEINGVLNEWTKPVKVVFDDFSIVFYGKVLLLSAINQELRGVKSTSFLKSAYFLAGHTIYLDEDVELFGVDLAIIAPNWRFLKKIKINLNGADGRNWTESANPDECGKPGKPGESAGNFLGVGDYHEKFLLVSANGGRGGSGQNGARGRDGANNTWPSPPVGKPACTAKGYSFRNAFAQVITLYKVYNASGCGTSGKDGGIGGQGGTAGVITLIGRNSATVKSGLNGTSGSPGRGGAGGVGGRDGCFYEALDVDDEFLHRVTTVKCPTGNVLPSGDSGRDNHNAQGQVFPLVKENLKVQKCLHQFIRFAVEELDSGVILLLKQLNRFNAKNTPDLEDVLLEYKLLEAFDNIELYDVFYKKIEKYLEHSPPEPVLSYLKSIVLGRIAVLKKNINFYFIDLKNYLSILKGDIKATNERTREELQSSIYLKRKVDVKREQIKQNLKQMRFLLNTSFYKKFHGNCILTKAIDVLLFLVTQTSDGKHVLPSDRFESCRSDLDNQNNRETSLTTSVFRVLENLISKEDVPEELEKLKDAFCLVRDSFAFSEEEKNLIEAFTEELEHFAALYYFDDWERSKNLFLKSLIDLPLNTNSSHEEVWFLKGQLVDAMLSLEYTLAMDSAQQNLYLTGSKNTHQQIFQNKALLEDILVQAAEITPNRGRTPFCKNYLEAVFDQNSAVGEFYFWSNGEIKNKLRLLFSGAEIDLKSNLINRHVFDKNFLRFTSLKLELECRRKGEVCQEELDEALDNFKIEITHSGYSYYNWDGDTHIVISEKVSLEYSFRTRDDTEPEIYNALYKKCQNGEIKLSPFATWIIRLLPVNNKADFKKLSPFVDVVNIRLTGTGTYLS